MIENVIFHSALKEGAFSFRILDGESEYIENKYGIEKTSIKWLEIMITDYPGCNRSLNIADNFRKNLSDKKIQDYFKDIQPKDFFVDNYSKQIKEAWKNFYSEKKNIINHYGLKAQLKKLNEEVYELSEAIIEYEQEQSLKDLLDIKIVDSDVAKKEHIKEELADVLVMFEQFRLYYDIPLEDVKQTGIRKINRQIRRMGEEK